MQIICARNTENELVKVGTTYFISKNGREKGCHQRKRKTQCTDDRRSDNENST